MPNSNERSTSAGYPGGPSEDKAARDKLIRTLTFIILATWTIFFSVPFWSFPGMRSGIFVSSSEWNQQFPRAIATGTLIGLMALGVSILITAVCVFPMLGKDAAPGSPYLRRLLQWGLATMLLLLPLWGWGLERGLLRIWAHEDAPTLEQVTTTAEVASFYFSRGRPRLTLRIPPHGRFQIRRLPQLVPEIELKRGLQIPVSGRRTWVGVYYDTLVWPEEWLEPQE